MKQSGMTLEKYKMALAQAGPTGQQAFNKLAFSIATADTRAKSLSTSFLKLGTTLGNTLRWQISSSMLTGVMTAFSTAL
jgi:hypothetical protein